MYLGILSHFYCHGQSLECRQAFLYVGNQVLCLQNLSHLRYIQLDGGYTPWRFHLGSQEDSDSFLAELRGPGRGCNLTLLAAAQVLRRPIRIVRLSKSQVEDTLLGVPDPQGSPLILGHVLKYHFVSLIPLGD